MITKQDVVFLCDIPLAKEEQNNKPFSEFSSMEAKTMLYEASMLARIYEIVPELAYTEEHLAKQYIVKNNLASKVTDGFTFLHSSNVAYINLFSKRYEKGDLDFIKTIVNKKNIPANTDKQYIQLEWLNDIYIREDYYALTQETIALINKIEPKLIICAGKWSSFFFASYPHEPTKQLTTIGATRTTIKTPRNFGINSKLRGSMLTTNANCGLNKTVLIPILTPAFYFQVKNYTPVIKADFIRCATVANRLKTETIEQVLDNKFDILIGTNLLDVTNYLNELISILDKEPTKVSIDIETRFNHIDCIGITYQELRGMTIPFFKMVTEIAEQPIEAVAAKYGKEEKVLVPIGGAYKKYINHWSLDDEIVIHSLLAKVFLHPNCLHVGQNYNYDSQFINKLWKLQVYSTFDTMLMHHSLYNSQDKDLATLASKYCDNYQYWKDELDIQDNETRWAYNCKDILYTLQVCNKLEKLLKNNQSLLNFYSFQQNQLNRYVVDMMTRGILVNNELKEENLSIFKNLMLECLDKINYICNEEVNLNSTIQVKTLFKDILGIKPKYNRKSHSESFGADAMLQYLEEYPEYRTLLTLFLEYKSIKVFVATFLNAKLDTDGKMRCNYNIAGTKTYRFASRKNVYGGGCNLANVPSKGKIDLNIALQEYNQDNAEEVTSDFITDEGNSYSGILKLPNIKKMFIPEQGYKILDADYSAVDLNFVAWDSDCNYLKDLIREGKDVYSILASEYYQREISKKEQERQVFKSIVHGCVTGDHEVLTRKGWIPIETLQDGEEIVVYNANNEELFFEVPSYVNRDFVTKQEALYKIDSYNFSFLGTQDHKFIASLPDNKTIQDYKAVELPINCEIPRCGKYTSGTKIENKEVMQFLAAIHSNTTVRHVSDSGDIWLGIGLLLDRKADKLKDILNTLEIPFKFSEYNQIYYFGFSISQLPFDFNSSMLEPDWYLLDYCLENLQEYINYSELIGKPVGIKSDVIKTIRHLVATLSYDLIDIGNLTDISNFCSLSEHTTRELIEHQGTKVYCPTTSTGYFIFRYKGNIAISGNSNYAGKAPTLAAKAGLNVSAVQVVIDWYFDKCNEIPAWHRLNANKVSKFGYVTNVFNARGYFYDLTIPTWLNQVVAWIGQSSTACLINRALVNLAEHEGKDGLQVRLQTHDSLTCTARIDDVTAGERLKKYMEIEIPYEDKLVIKAEVKESLISYGDCG